MRYLIKYTPRHKEMLEYALKMAIAWYYSNIDPVFELMIKACRRHHSNHSELTDKEAISDHIRQQVQSLREIDYKGEAFGKYSVLKTINLSDKEEAILSEEEVEALDGLSEFVMRLMIGQVPNCFDWYYITYIDHIKQHELQGISTFLHVTCWNQAPFEFYGIRYSEESDILWDIHQVLRYARYVNFDPVRKENLRGSTFSDPPMHVAHEPLLKVKTID